MKYLKGLDTLPGKEAQNTTACHNTCTQNVEILSYSKFETPDKLYGNTTGQQVGTPSPHPPLHNFCIQPTSSLTLKGSPLAPKGSNADKTEGFPLKLCPPKLFSELEVGMENAANGSRVVVEAKGSEVALSSLATPSSAPSSRCEFVLKPLKLLTGLLDPAYSSTAN